MGYVAVKGGTEAVLRAEQLVQYFRLKGESEPITLRQIEDQMRLAVDRAMCEGSLYAPELAALALKQSEGDALEASFLLRAYRSTVPRIDYSLPTEGLQMRILRRISATFKDIPGGQILGPSRDYQFGLLNKLFSQESSESIHQFVEQIEKSIDDEAIDNEQIVMFPKVIDDMRQRGILTEPPEQDRREAELEPHDVTRKALTFPAPRSARLQILARGDSGSLLTFAYSSVRGFGDVHPILGELRVGYLPIEVTHPLTGEPVEIGEILATECEMVSQVHTVEDQEQQGQEADTPKFGLGYGFCFGQSEVKAMSMSMIDRSISLGKEKIQRGVSVQPAANEEFVLLHVDGIEASGFTAHFKLPHYVTFQSDINVLQQAQEHRAARFAEAVEQRQQVFSQINTLLEKNEA